MIETFRVDSLETKELVFVGAWEDAKFAWTGQIELLQKGIHPKLNLQKHFNKYGEKDLVITVGAKVKPELVQKEMMKFLAIKPKGETVKEPKEIKGEEVINEVRTQFEKLPPADDKLKTSNPKKIYKKKK